MRKSVFLNNSGEIDEYPYLVRENFMVIPKSCVMVG